MSMFLVRMQLHLPAEREPAWEREVYAEEKKAMQPYLDSGQMARIFREPGTRNHYALWDVADVQVIHDAYTACPMFAWMNVTVTPLCVNPNDPGTPARDLPGTPMTYPYLRTLLDQAKNAGTNTGTENGLELVPGQVSVHDHPGTDRGRQLHFMVHDDVHGWQKVAELGPWSDEGEAGIQPGYIDFLAKWDGRPVLHEQWQARIREDNQVLHPDYKTALHGPRARF